MATSNTLTLDSSGGIDWSKVTIASNGAAITSNNSLHTLATPPAPDSRATVVQKRLAIQVSVSDFDRLNNNDTDHLVRLIHNAQEKLRHEISANTRCADCPNLQVKVEKREDIMMARTRHILTTECKLRQPGMIAVVCPSGSVASVNLESITPLEMEDEGITPPPDPDRPATTFDDAW